MTNMAWKLMGASLVSLIGWGSVEAAVVVHYNFNETGTSVQNVGGGGYTATIQDGATTGLRGSAESGVSGNAEDRAFDNRNSAGHTGSGYTGHVAVPNAVWNNHLANVTAFTVSFWMNAEVVLNSSARLVQMRGLEIMGDGPGKLRFLMESSVGDLHSSAIYTGVDSWEFVALSFDSTRDGTVGNERMKIYRGTTVSGVVDAGNGNGGVSLNGVTAASGSSPFTIGNRTALDRSFDGLIDDFRIYDEAFDAGGIDVLRQLGVQGGASFIPEPNTSVLLLLGTAVFWVGRKRFGERTRTIEEIS